MTQSALYAPVAVDPRILPHSLFPLPGRASPVAVRAFRHLSREIRKPPAEAIEVRPVKGRAMLNDFVRLPYAIYADDPQWVAPMEVEVKEFLDPRRHPFYKHGTAQAFVAYRDGRPVGRIVASDDPHFNHEHQDNAGCFGMFECLDDQPVADALLNAAAEWVRAHGRSRMLGPIDYSTNYTSGLLIEGFDTPPRVWMNHHRPYYAQLLERWGLTKAKDLNAWWFDDAQNMLDRWQRLAEKLARRSGVVIRAVNLADFRSEVARCKQVYNQAWEQAWGFVKMSDAEFDFLANYLRRLAEPGLVLLAEVQGKPVGFAMTLPDFNEATKPCHGRLTRWGIPTGLAKFLYHRRKIRTARMAVLGLVEEFRGRGIAELLILQTLRHGKQALHYTGAELSWTLEDNTAVNSTIENVGGRRYKRYRIFERSLDTAERSDGWQQSTVLYRPAASPGAASQGLDQTTRYAE